MELTVSVAINGIHGHFSACVDVPEYLYKAFEPIDICDNECLFVGGNAVSDARAKVVMKVRGDAAKDLAARLAGILVDAMKAGDTRNGYPASEQEGL